MRIHCHLSLQYNLEAQLHVIVHDYCKTSYLVQDVADKKKEITDDDLLALITDEVNQPATLWSLLDLQVRLLSSLPKRHSLLLLLRTIASVLSTVVRRSSNGRLPHARAEYHQRF